MFLLVNSGFLAKAGIVALGMEVALGNLWVVWERLGEVDQAGIGMKWILPRLAHTKILFLVWILTFYTS